MSLKYLFFSPPRQKEKKSGEVCERNDEGEGYMVNK